MKVTEVMKERMSFSFEVFPPKPDRPMDPLRVALDHLAAYQPDFISCTYGAGGGNAGRNTEVCEEIIRRGVTAVTHFTCIGNTKEDVTRQLDHYLAIGVDHVLALRGDLPKGWEGTRGDFRYAGDLVRFIRKHYGDTFTIAVAADPEKHIECPSEAEDITHLKMKQDAGADYIMTQLCFDIREYASWKKRARKAGITLPIDVGVMPVLDKDATIRMALSVNGCSIPKELARVISRYYEDPEGFKEAGKVFTMRLIHALINTGIDGLHLYCLNRYKDVSDLIDRMGIRRIL